MENNKTERIKKLSEISDKLKKEFIGISDTIDSIIESITPWYVTPELIERPVVISIWGLTGTGKTSVVRRLIEELDVSDRSLFFDCGESDNTDFSISSKIDDFFSSNGTLGEISGSDTINKNSVFVFDEFQYSRTINEDGEEVSKPSQRCIWTLLDSGIIDYVVRPYEIKELIVYSEELGYLMTELGPDLQLNNGFWPTSINDRIHETLDFYKSWDDEEDDKDSKDSENIPIIRSSKKETLVNRLNAIERGLGYSVIKKITGAKTLGELVDTLKSNIRLISKPKQLNFGKSLVFIIGNIDEAFGSHSDLDPDMDADVFAKITKRTCVTDIKEALKKRFRIEQIGRLGNNMIIYPSLGKNDFKSLIDKEISKSIEKFKKTSGGIEVKVTDGFKDLLYSEGVIPSQGTRPVFTTIESTFLPAFSKILNNPASGKNVLLDTRGSLRSPEITIIIEYQDSGDTDKYSKKLNIGKLRSNGSCEKLAAHAVHEAGHAIMMTLEKGSVPEMILAQSSLGGGYTYENLDDKDKLSAKSKMDVSSDAKIGLAGNCAEHIFFDDLHCTIGCSSDFEDVWKVVSEAAYTGGFFGHSFMFSDPDESDGISSGFNTKWNSNIHESIRDYINNKSVETTSDLNTEKVLLKEVAKYLVDNYCMFPEVYREYVEKYGTEKIKNALSCSSDNYWLNALMKG